MIKDELQPKPARPVSRYFYYTLAAIVLAGAIYWYLNRTPSLLQQARHISEIRRYLWLSDHEIAAYSEETGKPVKGVSIDIDTGAQSSMSNNESIPPQSSETHLTQNLTISPDGKWLISGLLSTDFGSDNFQNIVTELTGDRKYDWAGYRKMIWLPDSRRLIGLSVTESQGKKRSLAAVLSLDRPEARVTLLLRAEPDDLLGVTPDNILLTTTNTANPAGSFPSKLLIVHTPLYPRTGQAEEFPFQAPEGNEIAERALSPNGKQLAWLLFSDHPPPLQVMLHRILPFWFKGAAKQRLFSIWVSGIDGRDARVIGSDSAGVDMSPEATPMILGWSRDSKRLSFVYHRSLYVIRPY